jgi:hypothetical protein
LSTVHGARYADYSHGVRLISTVVYVDGRPMSIFDVLADSQLSRALSDEGPLPRMASLLSTLAAPRLDTAAASGAEEAAAHGVLRNAVIASH